MDLDAFQPLFGLYATPSGQWLSFGRDDDGLFLMDYAARQLSRVAPAASGGFAVVSQPEAALSIAPAPDGAHQLRLQPAGASAPQAATRQAHRLEDLTIENGDVTLAGRLWLPDTQGPHPAIVLVGGAGPGTRESLRDLPYFLLGHGFAVVTYDKRGCGASTGDYQPWVAGIRDLAGDAMAAMDPLLMRHDIRPDQIGLLGTSLGAWVVDRAVARVPETAFAVLLAGGGVPVWEAELHHVAATVRSALGEGAVEPAAAFTRAVFAAVAGRPAENAAARSDLGRLLAAAASEAWFPYTRGPEFVALPLEVVAAVAQAAWDKTLSYDPAGDLAQVYCPVLALIGDQDDWVPGPATRAALERHLAGNDAVTLKLLPGADHGFAERAAGLAPGRTAIAAGYYETLGPWLVQQVA